MTLDSPFPVIVSFGDRLEAHLWYGEPMERLLDKIKKRSIHLVLGSDCRMPDLWVPDGAHGTLDDLDAFLQGCCPECSTPHGIHFDVIRMDEVQGPRCFCGIPEPIPCTVLDLNAGSGDTAVRVLKAGLQYIGFDPRLECLGVACKRIREAAP